MSNIKSLLENAVPVDSMEKPALSLEDITNKITDGFYEFIENQYGISSDDITSFEIFGSPSGSIDSSFVSFTLKGVTDYRFYLKYFIGEDSSVTFDFLSLKKELIPSVETTHDVDQVVDNLVLPDSEFENDDIMEESINIFEKLVMDKMAQIINFGASSVENSNVKKNNLSESVDFEKATSSYNNIKIHLSDF